MPVYIYRREDTGEAVEIVMTNARRERRERRDGTIRLADGTRARRDVVAEQRGHRPTPGCWPKVSLALAVHPAQAKDAARYAEEIGIPTEFRATGEPVFTGPAHFKKYGEAHGYYDRDGGYGSPQTDGKLAPDRAALAERS